jgi:hypothetical protein
MIPVAAQHLLLALAPLAALGSAIHIGRRAYRRRARN